MGAPPSNLDPSVRARLVLGASRLAVGVALTLGAVKLAAFLATDSIALLGTLADSVLDAVASALTLFANRAAVQPADEEHRFGHGKAEALAGLGQAAFVGGSALLLGVMAVQGLITPRAVVRPAVGMAAAAVAIVGTLGLVLYQRRVVRLTGALSIEGDLLHYTSDVALNLSVILALWLSSLGWAWADPVLGLAVAAFIAHGAWGIGRRAVDMLMDHELPAEDRARIEAIAHAEPEVRGVHDLRTRRSGGLVFVQLHIDLAAGMPLRQAHDIGERVEFAIIEAVGAAEVLVHHDPV
ncbi:MAG: cation diffusion facilitator family transporter [Myxococcales bacterium]|nr:cation diffusion facilitator family transporter [Myxococcales bacterium]